MSKQISPYLNRDLSWVEFNRRVLQEAQDGDNPLLERAKFLAIVSTNLDEFMSVRIAGIHEQIRAGLTKTDFTGYSPDGLWRRLLKRTKHMVIEQYRTYREVLKCLHKKDIYLREFDELSPTAQKAMEDYYNEIVFPVITPMAVDQSRPFPHVHTKELYLAVTLGTEVDDEDNEPLFAIIQIPSILPRCVPIPGRSNRKKQEFMLLEDIITTFIDTLFTGYKVFSVSPFRLTRNSDLAIDEEAAEDLLEEIEKELRRRKWGVPVRLEVESDIDPYALELLKEELEIDDGLYMIDGPLDLSFLMKLANAVRGHEQLRYKKFEPHYPDEFEEESIISTIAQRDVLLYHPYESFEPVNEFVWEAAQDPDVLAIKMTMYRVSGQSSLVKALESAAAAGKQVTVIVELKARFDEENNIAWAKRLEKAGCHVVYGLVGLKIHAKMLLVVRREKQGLKRYVHVGTGNYNENTAKLYTDIGLMTSNDIIGADTSALFNEITGYSAPRDWEAFAVAPTGLKTRLLELIDREIEHAKNGKQARIVAKMNSLSNQEMIDKLYEASSAGVSIQLIVRGVCSLRPGVPGISENIQVISIVDRYLEHSRIHYFYNAGEEELYLSSADWMTRNLQKRVELMCPVFDSNLKKSLINILNLSLADSEKARVLRNNGQYEYYELNGEVPFRSQFAAQKVENWKVEVPE